MDKVCGLLSVISLGFKLELDFLSLNLYFLQFFLKLPEGKKELKIVNQEERVLNPLILLLFKW